MQAVHRMMKPPTPTTTPTITLVSSFFGANVVIVVVVAVVVVVVVCAVVDDVGSGKGVEVDRVVDSVDVLSPALDTVQSLVTIDVVTVLIQ